VTTQDDDWPDLSGTEVQIIIDETSDAVKNYYNGVGDGFNQATGANVNLEFVGRNVSGVQRVTQLLQAGDPPEIFAMNQNNATAFENQGVIEPVTDTMEEIEGRLGEAGNRVEFEGEQWLVPTFFNVTGWFWRGDIAEEVGMDRRPDWTWDTALEFAQMADENTDIRGIYIPTGSGPHAVSAFMAWLRTNEGSVVEREGDRIVVNFDQGTNRDRMIETLEFLGQAHEYSPVASDSGYGTWARAVTNGVSASGNYIGYRPKMYAVQDEREFAADIHASQMPEKRTRTTDGNVDGFGVFSDSNVEAAKVFLRFFTQLENMLDLYKINPVHDVPPYPEVRESEEYNEFLESLPDAYTPEDTRAYQEEVAQNFVLSINETDPANPYAGTIAGADAIPNMVQAVLLDDEDADSAIDEHAQQLQQTLDQAQS
jgi:ABC-type glycerol-3-phosphate transport system substrate-binding protein